MPSAYFSKLNLELRSGIRRLIVGQQVELQSSVEVLLGQGKLLFTNSGLSLVRPISTIGEALLYVRPDVISAVRSDPKIVNRRRNLSVVGAVSRTFSIPSVSGPSCQVCEYHIDRILSDSTPVLLGSPVRRTLMAACSSGSLLGQHFLDNIASRNDPFSNSIKGSGVSYCNKSLDSCRKATMSLRNQEPSNNYMTYGYFIFDVARRSCSSNPLIGPWTKKFYSSSSACYSTGAASEVSFDGSAREEQIPSSVASSDQKILGDRTLKLLSGSCYLPHPDKEETGGEDAHFICVEEQAIGVADGVGGWAELGVDAGQYARELMSNSVTAILEEPKGSIDPARVLEKAHLSTKAKGSSTACIIALTDQGLHAINLGDSGFIVVRDGCTVFRSPVQQHGFNFTFQLESGNGGDLPSSGQVFTIPVAPGDVVIAGTDGLFDNLYNNEVTAVVVHAMRAGLEPHVTAQKIAALARQRAQDRDRQTPFSTAAQDAGFRYYGGKLDDITVVVSYITSSTSPSPSSNT
ncbi:probable protein phosphatase 2C 55 [Macadamia integrifolia]|uniref:probable protein phosphatase 2C 55 n=1 Tax=Macadamia integrifolia TaxID=60698 RepID=UPI001C4EFFEE|nr:probable protein phosphatase 2C 55 [Macadamia integrifolia]